jgi:hypothetical protein
LNLVGVDKFTLVRKLHTDIIETCLVVYVWLYANNITDVLFTCKVLQLPSDNINYVLCIALSVRDAFFLVYGGWYLISII